MIYLFQAILLVFVVAFTMTINVICSCSNYRGKKVLPSRWQNSIALAGAIVTYAVVNYSMLDFLMLVPGVSYVIA